jgi:bacterioferritin-associated ferredoxin
MDLDAKVCYCFHVSRRKLLNYIRIERPCVASQLSQCGGAGTGCGWCVPFLQQLFREGDQPTDLDELSAEDYARRRKEYLKAGKGTPPAGAAES